MGSWVKRIYNESITRNITRTCENPYYISILQGFDSPQVHEKEPLQRQMIHLPEQRLFFSVIGSSGNCQKGIHLPVFPDAQVKGLSVAPLHLRFLTCTLEERLPIKKCNQSIGSQSKLSHQLL